MVSFISEIFIFSGKIEKLTYFLEKTMSSIIVEYFTPDIQSIVFKMLGLRKTALKEKLVFVTDATSKESDERLISLHFNILKLEELQEIQNPKKALMDEIRYLSACRGIVFDISDKSNIREVKRSFGKTVLIHTNRIPLDRYLPVKVEDKLEFPTCGEYKECYGGSLLCSYYWNGKVRLSTFRKLDATKSHFGDSDNFVDIWLNNQDVFPSVESLYPPGSDKNVKHLFIINDRKLLIDTRNIQQMDHVVYINSFDSEYMVSPLLEPMIKEANIKAKRPMLICKGLTGDETNRKLSGSAFYSESSSFEHTEILDRMRVFSAGEKIIYTNNFGIFTLVPESSYFRQVVMDGKNNIDKLFIDCMSDVKNSRRLVDIAFSIDDLKRMDGKIQNGESINIDEFNQVYDNRMLMVLTNLVFTVPLNRVDSCFEAFKKFEDMIGEAILFIIEQYNNLIDGINKDGLTTFQGLLSKQLRKYLCDTLPEIHDSITQPESYWSETSKAAYKAFYADYRQSDDQERQIKNNINMGIVAMISNAEGDLFYSFLTFKRKVDLAKVAADKREQKNLELEEM